MHDWTEFLGCKIDLSKRPMAPRPETEFWVEKFATSNVSLVTSKLAILDIFTGSGCIGIAVAKHFPNAHVTFADINPVMLEQVRINLEGNDLRFTIQDLRISNQFENIREKFDFILANPPYVAKGKGVDGIMDSEPHEALYAGKDGLDVIKPFLEQARDYLNPGGEIWMEFGSDQKEEVTNLLRELNYYQNFNCSFHKDQHDRWRYLIISPASFPSCPLRHSESEASHKRG